MHEGNPPVLRFLVFLLPFFVSSLVKLACREERDRLGTRISENSNLQAGSSSEPACCAQR